MNAGIRMLVVCAAALASASASLSAAERSCIDQAFRGFDTRLNVDIAGKVPVAEAPVGFELVEGRPVVAFSHRLIVIDGKRLIAQPSLDAIQALTVDANGRVRLQANNTVRLFGPDRLVDEGRVAEGGLIHNSGAPTYLLTASAADRTRVVFAGEGTAAAALDFTGRLTRASLNAVGFAAIIGDALVTWTPGSTTVDTLALDIGLRQAIDVVLIGPNRVVVALPNVVVLVTDRTRIVLGGLSARIRWKEGTLYALDQTSGIVWTLTGLEAIGVPEKDRERARQLAGQAASAAAPEYLEAVRLAGCKVAEEGARFLKTAR